MSFKDNVLFYINEKKDDDWFDKKKKAGCEADGCSVKTKKKQFKHAKHAKNGGEAWASEDTEDTEEAAIKGTAGNGCEPSCKTETKKTKKKQFKHAKNGGEAWASEDTEEAAIKGTAGNGCEPSCKTEADKMADKDAKKATKGAVAKRYEMMTNNQDFLDRYVDSIAKKKKKPTSSDDTEEFASTVAAYDGKKAKVDPETNEIKKDAKMKGYDVGKMTGVGNGRKPNISTNAFDGRPSKVVPETNEIKKDTKMKGYSLKESILSSSRNMGNCLIKENYENLDDCIFRVTGMVTSLRKTFDDKTIIQAFNKVMNK